MLVRINNFNSYGEFDDEEDLRIKPSNGQEPKEENLKKEPTTISQDTDLKQQNERVNSTENTNASVSEELFLVIL